MKYRLYTTSQKAWDGTLKAIKKAKHSIYIEMFIFLNDTKNTHDFIGTLKDKAKAGLEVIIIVDAYGSYNLKKSVVSDLRESGVEFLYFSNWIRRNHRKIIIIDKEIAFLGGVNIKNKTRAWHDLQVKVSGSIVKPILKSFARCYFRCGGKKTSVLKYNKKTIPKKIKSWVIDNWKQTTGIFQLNNYYKEKIGSAKFSIKLLTPYLLPPRWLIIILIAAVNRGVKVEIIIPKDTDVKSLNRINYINACRLSAAGVNIYFTKYMNHAKIMLIDEKEGLIGSQNLDILSFNTNVEAGIFFQQKDLVKDLSIIIEKWKKQSQILDLEKKRPLFFDRLAIFFLRIFYPVFK
jgi:cardiolipin synthase A/B